MKKMTPYAGLATFSILYLVILIAAIPYQGQQGETYSIFNHFISELGSKRFSVNQFIYNAGVVVAALGFGAFTYGLRYFCKTRTAKLAVNIGVFSSILCVGVGLVSEDYRFPHLILAFTFFCMMTLAVTLFSISILREKENPFPRYLGVHGLLVPLAFAFFMAMPKHLMAAKRVEGALFERPQIWWLPFMEWCLFFVLTTWIMFISIRMFRLMRQKELGFGRSSSNLEVQ
jgi:hypothetical membrane protein